MNKFIYRPERPLKEIVAFLTGLISGIFIGKQNCPRPPWDNNWGISEESQEKPSEKEFKKSKEKQYTKQDTP